MNILLWLVLGAVAGWIAGLIMGEPFLIRVRAAMETVDEECFVRLEHTDSGTGLSEEAKALADERIRIPMEGRVDSLNAAVAAAVLLFEAKRQRTIE